MSIFVYVFSSSGITVETYNNNINLTKHPDIINASMKVTQNDKDTNEIVVRVFNNDGTEIDYSGISTAQILFTKPDYRTVQGNMTVRENDLYYKMGTNEIACTGKVVAQVQLLGADGARLTVGGFRFEVIQDPVTPWSVQSTSEYGILQQLVADLEAIDVVDLTNQFNAHMAESANKFDKLFAFRNDIEIIAHRGFTQDFPENTLSALYAAAENKFHSTEFDIQISSDGEYMLMHDGTVDRTTDGTGDINDLTYAALRLLDAGTYKNARWAGAKIPTLEEYLLAGRGLFKTMYVELKNDFNETQIDEILAIIDDCDMTENVVIDSFYWDNLVRVRNANEFIPIGYHPASYADMVARIPTLSTMEYATIFAEYTILIANPTVVHTCRESGVDVGVYPILYSYEAQDMIDIGVVRLLSDVMIKGAK